MESLSASKCKHNVVLAIHLDEFIENKIINFVIHSIYQILDRFDVNDHLNLLCMRITNLVCLFYNRGRWRQCSDEIIIRQKNFSQI